MKFHNLSIIALLFGSAPAVAELASHVTTTTDANGFPTAITETTADSNRNVRINTHGVNIEASAVAEDGNSASNSNVRISRGAINDSVVFLAGEGRVVAIDGGYCQEFSADSALPSGVPAGMADIQNQLAAQQSQIDSALAELAQQDPRMAEQLRNMTRGGVAAMVRPRNTLEVTDTGRDLVTDGYATREFEVRVAETGELRQTVLAARVDTVPGARLVSEGMLGMLGVYKDYMSNMNAEALADTAFMGAFEEKMREFYPILIVNHETNEETRLTSIDGQGNADFSIPCDAQ